ncbi:hypothetical protein pdam_00018930 [Pocillopora damicornis]|uniref:Uncharacterized protein n=1 Tax=Pocillopora damicornis TaxID=46731 RepID=A0A3M6UP86_POCDA|nr:hypothetical protein pdam_00018930 [Pocillopora damicornis]
MFLKVHYQMFSGFLISVSGQIIANEFLVLAKASHSQRMNDSRVGLLQKEEQANDFSALSEKDTSFNDVFPENEGMQDTSIYQNNSGVGDQIRLIFVETTVQQSAEITASSKNKRHNGIRVLYNFQPLKVFCGTFAVQNGFKHNNDCFPTSSQTRYICMANMIPSQPRVASIVRRTPPTIPVKRKEKLKSVPTQA